MATNYITDKMVKNTKYTVFSKTHLDIFTILVKTFFALYNLLLFMKTMSFTVSTEWGSGFNEVPATDSTSKWARNPAKFCAQ